MKRDDSVYLRHILDAIAKVEVYLCGKDETTFSQDTLLQDGVIRQIEIIGEATRRLSQELRARYEHLPWQDIVGMRNKLIHGNYLPKNRFIKTTKDTKAPKRAQRILLPFVPFVSPLRPLW